MKTNKYKILVLSDMENTLDSTLKSTISFAKMIDANIEFFYVKQPTEVVGSDSQLSAMRTMNKEFVVINNRLEALADSISKTNGVDVSYNHTIGNVKTEIKNRLTVSKPDMVIIGKRKPKALNFIGDRITDFIIKNYDGSVVVASEINSVEPDKEVALGFFNNNTDYTDLKFVNELLSHSKKPVTAFKIHSDLNNSIDNVAKTVEYTFDDNDKFMDNLKMYLKRSGVNLLCLDRNETTEAKTNIIDLLDKIDVSLMVTSK
ncbi:hypothetical protein [Winogradskyella ursingii]|uniref:hypothetical protein n=1 Tax=Winogradskyella ursingii TaxID=2686079 RepID=UPI0015C73890|nr:hypothetical protein [Winogradskyella ursingii]